MSFHALKKDLRLHTETVNFIFQAIYMCPFWIWLMKEGVGFCLFMKEKHFIRCHLNLTVPCAMALLSWHYLQTSEYADEI